MASRHRFTSLLALGLALALAGCSTAGSEGVASSSDTVVLAATSAETSTDVQKDTHFDADDLTWDTTAESVITLANGASASDAAGVKIEGDAITITQPGDYRISGALAEGSITVDAPDAVVRLILDGVELANTGGSPLVVNAANEVLLYTQDGTQNSISDGAEYTDTGEDAPNAAIYSKADLTIAGTGTLKVIGNHNDAINVKDGLVIASGTLEIEAIDDGIRGKDYVAVTGGSLKVTAGDDGIKADNEEDEGRGWLLVQDGTLNVSAGDDGIKAYNKLAVTGGSVSVAKSEEGLEAAHIALSGGVINVTASDDGLNAAGGQSSGSTEGTGGPPADAQEGTSTGERRERPTAMPTDQPADAQDAEASGGSGGTPPEGGAGGPGGGGGGGGMDEVGDYSLVISGGEVTITADGDGIDSNGTATITGGTTVVNGPTSNGNAPIDVNGTFLVNGGTLAAAGSSGMAVTPGDDSTQSGLQAVFETALQAGTVVQIADANGNAVASFTTTRSTASLIYSDAGITEGQVYTLYTGGGSATDAGLGTGSLDGATKLMEATAGQYTGGMAGGR